MKTPMTRLSEMLDSLLPNLGWGEYSYNNRWGKSQLSHFGPEKGSMERYRIVSKRATELGAEYEIIEYPISKKPTVVLVKDKYKQANHTKHVFEVSELYRDYDNVGFVIYYKRL